MLEFINFPFKSKSIGFLKDERQLDSKPDSIVEILSKTIHLGILS